MKCRHCKKRKINRPSKLCWGCYYRPTIRVKYPPTSKYAYRGVGNFTGNAPLADEPTTAEPGTPEKIAVFEERAKRNQSLFHPEDAELGSVQAKRWVAKNGARHGTGYEADMAETQPAPQPRRDTRLRHPGEDAQAHGNATGHPGEDRSHGAAGRTA